MARPERIRTRPVRRIGFTLIELMVVIVIIGILVSLLLPVIIRAVSKANEARISSEIQTIAAGLSTFKNTYGEFPPSRVVLSEQGCYSEANYIANGGGAFIVPGQADYTTVLGNVATNHWIGKVGPFATDYDISFGTLAERSLRILRKMFPRVAAPLTTGNAPYWHDFNGDGVLNPGFRYLEGHECLVFFLGGIPNPTQNPDGSIGFGMTGFGRDPRQPFSNSGLQPASMPNASVPLMISQNRTLPSYEFRGDRLVDVDDSDGMPGYVDPLGSGTDRTYYAYFAAYGAAGYDPNDDNRGGQDDASSSLVEVFHVGTPVIGGNNPNITTSPAPNPYTSTLPSPTNLTQPTSYMNATSYQVISAGGDRAFGRGGQYQTSGNKLPPSALSPNTPREYEDDNVTNFASGRLN